ncbi:hypothetical protein CDIK_0618 [Cucumispora dikerogammari]|nr:hypothetical protein CDIK_0618 [Cucumispora dikerogammari]
MGPNKIQEFLSYSRFCKSDIIQQMKKTTPAELLFCFRESLHEIYIRLLEYIVSEYHIFHLFDKKEKTFSIRNCVFCESLMSTLREETKKNISSVEEIIKIKIREFIFEKKINFNYSTRPNCIKKIDKNHSVYKDKLKKNEGFRSLKNTFINKNIKMIKIFLINILCTHNDEYNNLKKKLEQLKHLNTTSNVKRIDLGTEWSEKFRIIRQVLYALFFLEPGFLCVNEQQPTLFDLVNIKKNKIFINYFDNQDLNKKSKAYHTIKLSLSLHFKNLQFFEFEQIILQNIFVCCNCLKRVSLKYDTPYVTLEELLSCHKLENTKKKYENEIRIDIKEKIESNSVEKLCFQKKQLDMFEIISLISSYFKFLSETFKLAHLFRRAIPVLYSMGLNIKQFINLYTCFSSIYLDSLFEGLIKIREVRNDVFNCFKTSGEEYENLVFHFLFMFGNLNICRFGLLVLSEELDISNAAKYYKNHLDKTAQFKNLTALTNVNQNAIYCPISFSPKSSYFIIFFDKIQSFLKTKFFQKKLEESLFSEMIKRFYSGNIFETLCYDLRYFILEDKQKYKIACESVGNSGFFACVDYSIPDLNSALPNLSYLAPTKLSETMMYSARNFQSNYSCNFDYAHEPLLPVSLESLSYTQHKHQGPSHIGILVKKKGHKEPKYLKKISCLKELNQQTLAELIKEEANYKYNQIKPSTNGYILSFNKFKTFFNISKYSYLKIRLLGYVIELTFFQYNFLKKLVDEYEGEELSIKSIEYDRKLDGLKDILISVVQNRAHLICRENNRKTTKCLDIRFIESTVPAERYNFISSLKKKKEMVLDNLDRELIEYVIEKKIGRIDGDNLIYIP